MQEYSFLPSLEINKEDFWAKVKAEAKQNDADEILIYMWRMIEQAKLKGVPLTRKILKEHGQNITYFDGVEEWFDRMSLLATKLDLHLEHYVISSGNIEMIEGCKIYPKFKHSFASQYIYDSVTGAAMWPGLAVNYTNKTQFLFRINKGILNAWDNEAVNRWVPMADRPIPFERMIFIGDGATDIPCMKMVRLQGGTAIAVYDATQFNSGKEPEKVRSKYANLISEDRANYLCPANYRSDGQLAAIVEGVLGRIAREAGYRPNN